MIYEDSCLQPNFAGSGVDPLRQSDDSVLARSSLAF